MRSTSFIFAGIFITLGLSWVGIVVTGHIQFGDLAVMTENYQWDEVEEKPMREVPESGQARYPELSEGMARQGKDVYVSLGCVACHTQQVGRADLNTDIVRGWGKRETFARDYIRQDRVLLGSLRVGSDLTNVGGRLTSREQTHLFLFDPSLVNEKSTMPPYPFLYERQEIRQEGRSPGALKIPEGHELEEGYEIVPTKRAEALVAYLHSLNIDYALPEIIYNRPHEKEEKAGPH